MSILIFEFSLIRIDFSVISIYTKLKEGDHVSVEDELKSLILSRYKSLREFCIVVDLPYSTVTSILKRGIENAGISKVIKICKHFNISADELANGRIVSVNYASYDGCLTERESIMVKKYRCLTPEGKETVDTILDLQYKAVAPKVKNETAG